MADEKHEASQDQGAPKSDEARVAARRRLLKAGIGVAPVAATLASRPVLACQTTKASAFHSFATIGSRAHNVHQTGCKPHTYWAGCTASSFPSTCRDFYSWDGTKKCSAVWGWDCFYGSGISGCDNNTTLLQLCKKTGAGAGSALEFAQFCAAAHVNCEAGYWNGLCTTSQVRTMWLNCGKVSASYYPTGGVEWTRTTTIPATACPPDHSPGCRGYLMSSWT